MNAQAGIVERIKGFIAAPIFEQDEEKTRAAYSLNPLLLGLFVLVLLGALATVFVFAAKVASAIGVLVLFLMVLVVKVLLQRGLVRQASFVFLINLWIVSNTIVVLSPDRNPIVAANVSLMVIAGLVLGTGAALVVAIVSSMLYLVLAIVVGMGVTLPAVFPGTDTSAWLMLTMSLVMALVPLNLVLRSLRASLSLAQQSNLALEAQQQQLETLVAERTGELTRRTSYLGATTAIAGAMAAVQMDAQSLLARVVHIISEQFGFYHTGIFLVDETETWAVLQAASSEGGQRMMERGHQLRVGLQGIVGAVVARGEVRIAQDVGRDTVYFDNPDLPGTRSEIALPLRVRNKTIGVLDVQSTESEAFTAEDITILQAIADQVAVAISNTNLLQQVEERVADVRRLYAERSREAWQELLQTQSQLSLVSDARGISKFDIWEPQMRAAAQTGEVINMEGLDSNSVALPLKVRDQVIGVIDGRKPAGVAWNPLEIALLETLAEQLSVALESGRLYQETQRRAVREQIVSEITGRMRATLNIETVLQTAAQEISEALGLLALDVRLGVEE